MTPHASDLQERIERLQRWLDAVHRSTADLHRAAATQVYGKDSTNTIRITITAAGVPVTVRIRDDWPRHVAPEHLGAAVMQAFYQAANRTARYWSTVLSGSRWRTHTAAVPPYAAGPGSEAPAPRRNVAPTGGAAYTPRELAEEVVRALAAARADQDPARYEIAGHGGTSNVTVVLSGPAGQLQRCDIPPHWAAHRRGQAIAAAVNEAAHDARERLDQLWQQRSGTDELLAGALAALTDAATHPPGDGSKR